MNFAMNIGRLSDEDVERAYDELQKARDLLRLKYGSVAAAPEDEKQMAAIRALAAAGWEFESEGSA